MPKSSRNVTLCHDSWKVANEMPNFSAWVRDKLLKAEYGVDLSDMSDRRILSILLGRIQSNDKFGFGSEYEKMLLDLMTEL